MGQTLIRPESNVAQSWLTFSLNIIFRLNLYPVQLTLSLSAFFFSNQISQTRIDPILLIVSKRPPKMSSDAGNIQVC